MNDYLSPRDRLHRCHPPEFRFGLALISLGIILFLLMDNAGAKEIYTSPSIIPASMKVCDGLLKLKRLKGKTYATMAQEVSAGGRRVYVTVCAYR
jgi:hypothetical protein